MSNISSVYYPSLSFYAPDVKGKPNSSRQITDVANNESTKRVVSVQGRSKYNLDNKGQPLKVELLKPMRDTNAFSRAVQHALDSYDNAAHATNKLVYSEQIVGVDIYI